MTKPKRPLRFEYGKNDDGQFYWHVKSPNGEIICQGEGYERKAGVLKVYRALFEASVPPTITYLNAGDEPKPRFLHPKCCGKGCKKPKHYEGKINRSWP